MDQQLPLRWLSKLSFTPRTPLLVLSLLDTLLQLTAGEQIDYQQIDSLFYLIPDNATVVILLGSVVIAMVLTFVELTGARNIKVLSD